MTLTPIDKHVCKDRNPETESISPTRPGSSDVSGEAGIEARG